MLNRLRNIARAIGLGDKRCPTCGVLMSPNCGATCPDCAKELAARTGGYCLRCGLMFGENHTPATTCSTCRTTPPNWETFCFHGRYTGLLRDLILGFKFNNNLGRTHLLGSLATAAYRSGISECPDAICPVPLHTKRLIWRGFNQSTELAKQISRSTNIPVLNTALVRTRNTKPQTQLGHKERKENLKNAFAANPEQIRGKSILLIDDVYTTGATLRECSKAILGAGAAKVDVLVLARTQEEPI